MKVGILGGGQLAQMLSVAAKPLAIETLCLDPTPDVCANSATRVITANYDDKAAIEAFAKQVSVVTYETENIPLQTIKHIETLCPLYPSIKAIENAQDRLLEKTLFQSLGIQTAQFAPINSWEDLSTQANTLGLPAVLKTRRFGYDGKGQAVLRTQDALKSAWNSLGKHELILEKFVNFDRELSLIGVRDTTGNTAFYPLTENQHRDGILRLSIAPFDDAALQAKAESYMKTLFKTLNYVGVLSIEFFQQGDQLIANEMAPRVHNSGHWTQEGTTSSQFENHIRAITGLPLGDTTALHHTAMINMIGKEIKGPANPAICYHTYGKAERPNRKVGHINLTADTLDELKIAIEKTRE